MNCIIKSGRKWGKVGGFMFIGEYTHSLDSKSRLTIPAKFRSELGELPIVTKGLDGCLFLFPTDEWENIVEKLKNLPLGKPEVRAFTRYFLSAAAEAEVDKQGRIVVPTNLKEHAGIEKETVVVGVSSRIEIWEPLKWQEYMQSYSSSITEIAEKLVDLGI